MLWVSSLNWGDNYCQLVGNWDKYLFNETTAWIKKTNQISAQNRNFPVETLYLTKKIIHKILSSFTGGYNIFMVEWIINIGTESWGHVQGVYRLCMRSASTLHARSVCKISNPSTGSYTVQLGPLAPADSSPE